MGRKVGVSRKSWELKVREKRVDPKHVFYKPPEVMITVYTLYLYLDEYILYASKYNKGYFH